MEQSLDEIIAGKHQEGGANKSRRDRRARGSRGGEHRRGPRRAADDRRREPPCVLIKNLHRDINETELRDLFREVGPISRVSIDYDSSDKRTGRAWVLYTYGEDAAVAAGRFNGRRAVGQIITVKQVRNIGDMDQGSAPLRDRLGGSSRSKNAPAEKRKRQTSGRTERPRTKTQEELDAELDAYMNKTPASSATPSTAPPVDSAPGPVATEPVQPVSEPVVEDAMIE